MFSELGEKIRVNANLREVIWIDGEGRERLKTQITVKQMP